MIQYLAYSGDTRVFALFLVVLLIAALAIGYYAGVRTDETEHTIVKEAFSNTQAAIFGLSALILGFTFSLAAGRFDARRQLVLQEANAIGTTYLRADFLPADGEKRFRQVLAEYTRTRLDHYRTFGNPPDDARDVAATNKSQDELWAIATDAGRRDSRNTQLALLTQTLNDTIDLSAAQETSLRNRIPASLLAFVVIVVVLGAGLQGFAYGRARHFKFAAPGIYVCLVVLVIFTIVDLDRPQRGFIRVNLTPLETQLKNMSG